jgi:hypothetical protein
MSDGGRERASLGVEVWKSSQKWSAQRSAVRSIAWLGDFMEFIVGSDIACAPPLLCALRAYLYVWWELAQTNLVKYRE